MKLQYRRSFKLVPGVRLNVNKGGISWTIGPRGIATFSFGGKRKTMNVGTPGSGVYLSKQKNVKKKERGPVVKTLYTGFLILLWVVSLMKGKR